MIEVFRLPERWGKIGRLGYPAGRPFLPVTNKSTQRFGIIVITGEKMNVIGHDHISSDYPAVNR